MWIQSYNFVVAIVESFCGQLQNNLSSADSKANKKKKTKILK